MASIKNPCPNCGQPAISRSSRRPSENVVERYCICSNNACLCVFKTHTQIARIIHQGIDQSTLSSHDKQALR
jgi:hypothetical protein